MLNVITDNKITKVAQIVDHIKKDIEKGVLKRDSRLPSINVFSDQHAVARDTIEKAYNELKSEGYILSVAGKGFFVKGKKDKKIRILMVFNEFSSYKKILYDNFIEVVGDSATVEIQFHHYNPQILDSILDRHLGNYHYYVIMPHFYHSCEKQEYLKVLRRIPQNELMLLDKTVSELSQNVMSVYQDFKSDIFTGLVSAHDLLKKYQRITLVFPIHTNYPLEVIQGTTMFCKEYDLEFSIIRNPGIEELITGTVYLVNVETDLAQLIKKVRQSDLKLGDDIGLISFNETILKELLDITVVTTDFGYMGKRAAQMLLDKEFTQIKNPFTLIKRKSL